MSSVRDRIEHDQRHAAEKIVPTDARRVALGAAGPTLSTRQREQLAADQREIMTPSTRSAGGTGFLSGDMVRVRDRQVTTEAMKPESLRPKTELELAADAGLAMRERWAREARELEQAKIAARQKREADERAARERKAKQAQIAFQENAVIREASDLTADEAQVFWERLASMDAMLDAGAASIVAEAIRANRKV